MASNDTSNYREDVWNEVKDIFVGFERANDHTDPMNHILINTRDNQPFNLYIHGINVEGEIYHRQIKRDNSALDKVVEAGKTYCRTAKYAAEFKHLFEYGPYGVAVELAISKSNELIPDGNGGYTEDDLIWVKFFQDENNPDKFILNLPDDDYKVRWFRNVMNFVGLRVYPDSRTVVLRRNPVYRSPAYSTVEPSDTFDTNLGDEVDVAAVFDRDEMTEEYRRCKYDGYVALVGRPAGNEEDRNISPSDYHSKIPADLVGSKYHGRNSDWAGNIGSLIITGYPIKAFSYGIRLYPVENADNSIDYYPFKIYPGVPELYRYRDKIFDKMTISMNLDSDFESPVFGSLNPNDIKMPRYLLLSDLFNALAEKIRTIRGENAAARREALLRRNFERAGWETNENNFLWTMVKNWFNGDTVDIRPMSFSDLIGNDLNNISHVPHIASQRYQPYLLKLKDGTVKLEKTKRWYAQQLIKAINGRISWITSSELINGYRAGLNNLFVKEISGLSSASGATLSYPLMTTSTLTLDTDSGSLINRITPVQRPIRPSNDAPRAEKEQFNTLADGYNAYADKIHNRYGIDVTQYKIIESDKFDLSLPYQVKMPPEQFGNPQYDKPIDGMNPGDLIGFIAEMVYGIQNNDSVNVLNAIPGIYVPAVIPEQFRYLGRRDDIIKNQFTRTLNKWIELKPKNALIRDELDAMDELVNELIMLSGNPTTPSGLEDGSVYSLSTLFKGSLRKERSSTTANSNNRYEYNITFLRRDADTGRVYYRISRRNGEPMAYDRISVTTRISSSITLVYDGHDSYYLTADQIENDHDVTVSFEVHERDEREFPYQYTVENVIIPGNPRSKPEYTPRYADPSGKPPVDLGGGAVTNNPSPSTENPYTPEAEKDYRVSFDVIELTTGNAIFNVTESSGAQVTGTIHAYYNDKRYEVGDNTNPGRFTVPNSDLPEHEAIWHFTIGHRGANSLYEVKITTPGVSVPARTVEAESPHFVEPKYKPLYRYRIRHHEDGWVLSTEPIALFAVERIDGGSLPDDIEVKYRGHKYEISNGQFGIPNNDLPVHETITSMKVSYKDDSDDTGSDVDRVTVPAHQPHEFRIEKINYNESGDMPDNDVRYRITLTSGNRIEEESLTVHHGSNTFDVSTVTSEGGEFIIHNEQLPRGRDTWDLEVHYQYLGETVTAVVRDVEVESRIGYFVEHTSLDKQGAHYHIYRDARYNTSRENRQRLTSGKLHRGDKIYPISDGSAIIPNSDLPSWDIRGGTIKDTFIVEYTTPYGTYEDTVEDVIVPGEYYDVDRARAERELADTERRKREESTAGGIIPPESAHIEA